MKTKNVGFVHISFPFGGAEKVTIDVSKYLIKNGYNVFIFTQKIKTELLDSTYDFLNIITIEKKISYFIEQIKSANIDLLIFSTTCGFISQQQIEISKKSGVKYICVDHVKPFWEANIKIEIIKRKIQTRSFFSRLKYKILLKLHNQLREDERVKQDYRNILKYADAFVLLCEEYKKNVLEKLRTTSDKITIIPNPLLSAPVHYDLDKKNVILYMGRVEYSDKRVERLIEIWKRIYKDYPNWKLKIVGSGSDKAFLEQSVKKQQLERVTFFEATSTPHTFYNKASILCLTSQTENWPLVLMEAQQAGVVPMAFECSAGVSKILAPSSKNGILIPCYDMQKYESELRELIENEQKRKYIQTNILEKSKEYDINSVGKQWDDLFQKLLNS
ncbi:glycosyltransferase [Capnocytophaga sp. H4358]|uniref:glycosyltransferase n=1 Tax=Capnocytophaga sp. H4358 TaxID=1945658 RepID=UPI0018E3F7E7|nr:glycosyltransferase [Capnocytophaga sp. H4358]